ncbi:MAG: 5'/3'-nucleotidase SurE, partial [SAR202 cluster bacterium]
MKILLTNDDGIHSPGLWEAAKALNELGEVFIVAPDREQSGVGGSLTLHHPLMVHSAPVSGGHNHSNAITAYSVEGTPADCAILALEELI